VKGCSYNDFVANTTVPAAVSTDNIKACILARRCLNRYEYDGWWCGH
jgi:hypothetical protein